MKDVSPAAAYAALLPILVKAARDVGYALAVHGSMARDLDLIAVPWTEEAASAEQLILRLLSASGCYIADGSKGTGEYVKGDAPDIKPHGRMAWSLIMGNGLFLDVSVMPRCPRSSTG